MSMPTRILVACGLATAVTVALAAYGLSTPQLAPGGSLEPASPTDTRTRLSNPAVTPRKIMLEDTPVRSTDRIIVKFKPDSAVARSSASAVDAIELASARAGLVGGKAFAGGATRPLTSHHIRSLATGGHVLGLSRRLDAAEVEALLQQLRRDPAVQYAQPDYIKQALEVVPNDPYLSLQWHYSHPGSGISAPVAWEHSTGEGVVVAVLDTGHVHHADLDANLIPGYDFITVLETAGDGDGRDADARDPGDFYGSRRSSWHGTHVAGTVAAVTNNAAGVAGVAFGAKVQPVRVLGRGGGYTSDIADAMVWASGGHIDGVPDNTTPAEVLNLSLGGDGSCSSDPVMQDAVDSVLARGVVVVVAAGNNDADAANHSPASCRGVITVGASGVDGARSWFSNFGATVALSAPGGNATSSSDPDDRWIWSLGNSGTTTPVDGAAGEVIIGSMGTSQASPHVAAVVAMMQSAAVAAGHGPLAPDQIRRMLRATAKPFLVPPPTSKPQGTGILDAAAAVLAASEDPGDENAEELTNRVAVTALSGAAGESRLYRISVPAGRTGLNLRTYGGSGDVSIYVAYDRAPTTADYDRVSARLGNSETVAITRPAAGDYYVRIVGTSAYAGVTLLGVY